MLKVHEYIIAILLVLQIYAVMSCMIVAAVYTTLAMPNIMIIRLYIQRCSGKAYNAGVRISVDNALIFLIGSAAMSAWLLEECMCVIAEDSHCLCVILHNRK